MFFYQNSFYYDFLFLYKNISIKLSIGNVDTDENLTVSLLLLCYDKGVDKKMNHKNKRKKEIRFYETEKIFGRCRCCGTGT